ncbi:sensor histidine kinase [Alphaproteobacteria bacterium GH1-50]|uniref:histidine kinase n=1 Tax=Kangsaoukella pontilimi TaxID=2691042 RepID=A0A7C9J176_9RHOB|nr:HAMP domain-containing sensor histidine kinase [Kangsaoukella pontilimi]MXQ06621.1 sensor histidine kinase [Kangsaoukella pontilimi]
MRARLRRKWRPPLSLVLGGSLLAVLVLPVLGVFAVELLTPATGRRWAVGIVVLGAGAATLVLGYLLWRLILSPVRALGAQAAAIKTGSPVLALGRAGTPEISEVAELVLDMAETLTARELAVRSYTDHVTHELKTPLTAIRGAAELLEGDDTASDETRHLARTILDAEARAERLLAAARQVVAARTPAHRGTSRLSDGLAAWRERFPDLAFSVDGGEVALPIALSGLDIAVGHLAQNAIAAGASRLVLRASQADGRATLFVEDDGPGISEGNEARVFEPFFTTRRDTGGTGMGLAVVETMLRAQGADITLAPGQKGRGARFAIGF